MKKVARFFLSAVLVAGVLQAQSPQQRKIVYREEPDFPAIAAQLNLHGTVKLKIWIDADGRIRRLEYIGGHPLLAQAALKAVKDWKYEPGTKETTSQVDIKF